MIKVHTNAMLITCLLKIDDSGRRYIDLGILPRNCDFLSVCERDVSIMMIEGMDYIIERDGKPEDEYVSTKMYFINEYAIDMKVDDIIMCEVY